jgi:hypothetical protein
MNTYRVVSVDQAGESRRQNNEDAAVWAKQLVDVIPIELRSGTHFKLAYSLDLARRSSRATWVPIAIAFLCRRRMKQSSKDKSNLVFHRE